MTLKKISFASASVSPVLALHVVCMAVLLFYSSGYMVVLL